MVAILDHIAATVIGVTLLMALLSTQLRVQQAGIEQVSAHAAKTKALSLSQWLTDDITSLGANFGRNLLRFEVPQYDEHGNTSEWVFFSDSLAASGLARRQFTRYIIRQVDEIEHMGRVMPLYQLERQTASSAVVNGVALPPAAWRNDGKSVATLSRFRIGLVARDGTPTSDVERADYIRAQFAMVPEFERHRGFLRELHWSTLLKVRPFWHPPQDA